MLKVILVIKQLKEMIITYFFNKSNGKTYVQN